MKRRRKEILLGNTNEIDPALAIYHQSSFPAALLLPKSIPHRSRPPFLFLLPLAPPPLPLSFRILLGPAPPSRARYSRPYIYLHHPTPLYTAPLYPMHRYGC